MSAPAAPTLPDGVQVLERGWLSANNILFTGGERTALVDSGYCTHAPQTVLLVDAALAGRPLDHLLNTHLHSDHCGGNAALQAHYPGLDTRIPPGHAAQVARWDADALTYGPTGQRCPRFGFTGLLQPGTTLRLGQTDWQIHAAAGHDPHSIVLFEPASRTLISADALWENGFGVIFPELDGVHAFDEVSDTLDLIDALAPRTVIPGHGRVFSYSPDVMGRARQRLDYFVQHPVKHAAHAVKVLLKFKLLETQRQPFEDFLVWAQTTPYFELIRTRFFADQAWRPWMEQLSGDLVNAGVARREGDDIVNT